MQEKKSGNLDDDLDSYFKGTKSKKDETKENGTAEPAPATDTKAEEKTEA